MNVEDYIASGIIERYISGDVSRQEKQEVECMSHIYPEIAIELSKNRAALEELAEAGAVSPPASLKSSILDTIDSVEQTPVLTVENSSDLPDVAQKTLTSNDEPKGTKRTLNIYKAAILLVALSAGAAYLYMDSRSELNNSEEKLTALQDDLEAERTTVAKDISSLKEDLENYSNALSELNSELQIVKDPGTFRISLKGTDLDPSALASIYFNPEKSEIYIEGNRLEKLDEGSDYQLWAIVDGKPVDMGVFDPIEGDVAQLQKVDYIANPEAFAITIEPSGGSENPTLEKMIVIGKVEVS